MSQEKFFLTTPIYYINATPHIGHAYTQIAADARARFERLRGKKVLFLTGTDENAAKVARVAQELGRDPQDYCDELALAFRNVWDKLGISYDDYIRTTEPRHKVVVQKVVEKLWNDGLLELGPYSGWYSVPDETFFSPDEVVERDGHHYIANPTEDQSKAPLEWVEETVHYFKLSQFGDSLLKYYGEHPETLQPVSRRNEALAFIERGLQNTSISRVQSWGIPVPATVPEHEGHVVYVWFPDALLNYATAPGYLSDDPERRAHFDEMWPPDLQLMSKDIFTRFHASFWPALLQALGLELPKVLFSHGFWTVDGRKMAKRHPETIIEPVAFAQEIADSAGADFEVGVDGLRYYCLREVTFGVDGDFSREGCFATYNSDLANGLGNLVNRALSMLKQYFGGVVPEATGDLDLWNSAADASARVEKAYEDLEFHTALNTVQEIVSLGNRVIEEQKPWAKIKDGSEESRAQVATLLRELLQVCAWCSITIEPVMPHVARRLRELLAIENNLTWNDTTRGDIIATGHACQEPQPLFPRLQNKPQLKGKSMTDANNAENAVTSARSNEMIVESGVHNVPTQPVAASASATPEAAPEAPADPSKKATIEYEDFAKIELRAAKILEAERIPKADKLLKLQVDLGTEKRQILAGIAQQFEPEQLIGKTIVVVANLAPRKMRGLDSQGMLLAASETYDGPPAGLLTVDVDIAPGSIIR